MFLLSGDSASNSRPAAPLATLSGPFLGPQFSPSTARHWGGVGRIGVRILSRIASKGAGEEARPALASPAPSRGPWPRKRGHRILLYRRSRRSHCLNFLTCKCLHCGSVHKEEEKQQSLPQLLFITAELTRPQWEKYKRACASDKIAISGVKNLGNKNVIQYLPLLPHLSLLAIACH